MRNTPVIITLTDGEQVRFAALARKASVTLSTWLRAAAYRYAAADAPIPPVLKPRKRSHKRKAKRKPGVNTPARAARERAKMRP